MSKLVRDRIPDIIRANGEDPIFHIAGEEEYANALRSKLEEEVAEYSADPCAEEVADVEAVVRAIARHYGWDIDAVGARKEAERGGFEKRYILGE